MKRQVNPNRKNPMYSPEDIDLDKLTAAAKIWLSHNTRSQLELNEIVNEAYLLLLDGKSDPYGQLMYAVQKAVRKLLPSKFHTEEDVEVMADEASHEDLSDLNSVIAETLEGMYKVVFDLHMAGMSLSDIARHESVNRHRETVSIILSKAKEDLRGALDDSV